MDAQEITVKVEDSFETFIARENRTLRAFVGRHGELRICQVETLEDVDIETHKQKENVTYLKIFAENVWSTYSNDDFNS